jgi:hypothetical protein
MNSLILNRDIHNFNTRLKTIPVNAKYQYFSSLIFLYLNILIYCLLSITMYLMFFNGVSFIFFLIFLLKTQILLIMSVTLFFIVQINKIQFLIAIIGGGIVLTIIYIRPKNLIAKTLVFFENIKTDYFYYFIYYFFIIILLTVIGYFIYKKKQYNEV